MSKDVDNKRAKRNLLVHREEFKTVYGIITAHTNRVMSAMHNESLNMLWEVGAWLIIMVCNTICRMLVKKNGLQMRMQLCQSNWHKFRMRQLCQSKPKYVTYNGSTL